MKYVFSFISFFAFVFCYTQEFRFADNATFKPFPYSVESLDTSYQNIYYQLSFANNSEKPDSKKQAVCILELGKTKSKFFDFNSVKSDSLTKKYSVEKEITGKELTAMLAYKTNWENVLIRDIQTKNIIFQDHASKTFQYEGTQPELKWNLEKE
ncbi:GLPGLI family protein, partial [Elizabethkingia anophelis]|nr:GLPGLI family protein [Elizabethkingia anophelis]EJG2121152.1 GLPGLI family protein [Elizabethkingia anophelis]